MTQVNNSYLTPNRFGSPFHPSPADGFKLLTSTEVVASVLAAVVWSAVVNLDDADVGGFAFEFKVVNDFEVEFAKGGGRIQVLPN
jgi:hypothetical protein